jgi:hypothetical protein
MTLLITTSIAFVGVTLLAAWVLAYGAINGGGE